MHFGVLFATTALIFSVLIFAPKIKSGSQVDKFIRYSAVVLILTLEFIFIVMRIRTEINRAYLLPLELCTIAAYFLCYLLLSYNKELFKIVYFWVIVGVFLTLFFPIISDSVTDFRFWHYFVVHIAMLVMAIYLYMVERDELTFKDSTISWLINLGILLVIVVPVNLIFDTNFMFIMDLPTVFANIFSWTGRIVPVIWVIFIILLYNALYPLTWLLSKFRDRMYSA